VQAHPCRVVEQLDDVGTQLFEVVAHLDGFGGERLKLAPGGGPRQDFLAGLVNMQYI